MFWGAGLGPFTSSTCTIEQTLPLGKARAWGSSLNPTALHSATHYRVLPGLGGEELLVGSGQGASFTGIVGKRSWVPASNPGIFQPLRVFRL